MERMNTPYTAMISLYAEMVLDEAMRKFREERLYREIDSALAHGDENTFLVLTNELKQLLARQAG